MYKSLYKEHLLTFTLIPTTEIATEVMSGGGGSLLGQVKVAIKGVV